MPLPKARSLHDRAVPLPLLPSPPNTLVALAVNRPILTTTTGTVVHTPCAARSPRHLRGCPVAAAFRLTGGVKDFIAVGTDSGRITILECQVDKNQLERVHLETFGKSGCRRVAPGQYLVVDPKGRALMIGELEKQKLVYILNRDASARLTISSPLEAHKEHTLVFDMVGVDVGFENPVFACLEMDYEEADQDPTGEAATETQQTLLLSVLLQTTSKLEQTQ